MLAILFCIRDQHDPRLVALAGLICAVSSLAAIFLLRHALGSREQTRRAWLITAGGATAAGIWSTHFVAMLGYDPGVVVGYGIGLTLASLALAVVAICTGFWLAMQRPLRRAPFEGGVAAGLGIAGMHYVGMAAVKFPGHFSFDWTYVAASIFLVVAPMIAALRVARRGSSKPSLFGAAALILASVLMLHFTAMAGITLIPAAVPELSEAVLSPGSLAAMIGVATLALLLACVVSAFVALRARAAVHAREHELRILVEGISDCAIFMLDRQGRVASWNAGAERLKGYTAAEAIGLSLSHFYSESDRSSGIPQRCLDQAREIGKFTLSGWRYRKDGSRFWADVTIETLVDENGEFLGYSKVARDVTAQKESQDRLDAALSNMHQGLCLFDEDEKLVLANNRATQIFSLPIMSCLPGMTFRQLLRTALEGQGRGSVDDWLVEKAYQAHRRLIDQPKGGTLVADYRPDLALSIAHRPLAAGGWVTTFEDITERSRSEARIAHMALHDGLTGLPNREHFRIAFEKCAAQSGKVAIVAVDLNRFKEINDTRGHVVGDQVLGILGKRLAALQQEGEFISRLGGDEFAAFKPIANERELDDFLARLGAGLATPVELDGLVVEMGSSIGVALYPRDGDTLGQALNNADLAMYRAKATPGEQVCFYEPSMDENARARRKLAIDIRKAIADEEFTLAYQVQRTVTTGDIIGYEALIRWHHPRDGWVPASDFIPVAEDTGDIVAIGEWVLRKACAEAADWALPHKVAVNISGVQLMQVSLIDTVRQALLETGLSPSRLELEITETAIVSDKARALHVLRQIKALGVAIAIDDFGTGYSSLDTLNSFPFDKIKIDRSFLVDSETNPQARAIIRAVLALGQSLGVPVLAEGLETREQLEILRAEGCSEAQGYYFGKPQLTSDPGAPVRRLAGSQPG